MSRKNEILDALIDIFRSEGLSHNFTMAQLASKVNIGKSTLYEYFSNKDEIIKEALFQVFNRNMDGIFGREIPENKPFEEVYKGELKYLFTVGINSRFLTALVTPQVMSKLPECTREDIRSRMKSVGKHYENRFADIFRIGVEQGVITGENMLLNGIMISNLVTGSLMRIINAEVAVDEVPMDELVDAIYNASLKIAN